MGLAACTWIWIGPFLTQHTKLEINPVIGSFLAGILLSFGSKFWHDLLDLLSAVKNTQRHIPRQDVQFSNGSVHTLHDLVRLEKISIEGDSGSMIYDHNRQVIGMIVASDLAFTYALKIESILAQLSETYEIVPC